MTINLRHVPSSDAPTFGSFNIADAVLLQKWLLAVPDTVLPDWKAADLCEDDVLNVCDLCAMRQELQLLATS